MIIIITCGWGGNAELLRDTLRDHLGPSSSPATQFRTPLSMTNFCLGAVQELSAAISLYPADRRIGASLCHKFTLITAGRALHARRPRVSGPSAQTFVHYFDTPFCLTRPISTQSPSSFPFVLLALPWTMSIYRKGITVLCALRRCDIKAQPRPLPPPLPCDATELCWQSLWSHFKGMRNLIFQSNIKLFGSKPSSLCRSKRPRNETSSSSSSSRQLSKFAHVLFVWSLNIHHGIIIIPRRSRRTTHDESALNVCGDGCKALRCRRFWNVRTGWDSTREGINYYIS